MPPRDDQWCSGFVTCENCGHTHMSVWPATVERQECPVCGHMTQSPPTEDDMTPSELAEIDRQVAEAIGLEIVQQFHYGRPYCAVVKSPHGMSRDSMCCDSQGNDLSAWSPSTDWNDAMFAAEKAGLLEAKDEQWGDVFRLAKDWDGWDAERLQEPIVNGSSHVSGPLAICQAILRLKGKA